MGETEIKLPGNKKYYRMGEVTKLTGLEPHALRFWEGEFEQLRPKKSRSGHRTFTQADIDLIFKIKRLLHDEGFTIAGARKKLIEPVEGEDKHEPETRGLQVRGRIGEVRDILQNVLKLLDRE